MIALFFLFFFSFKVHSQPINSTWNKIENLIENKNFQRASNLLDIEFGKTERPSYTYFKLRGDTDLGLGQLDSAIENYKKSISLNRDQIELIYKVYQLYYQDRKYQNAFDFIRLFLANEKNFPELRYRALVLSSILNDSRYYQYSLEKIDLNNPIKNNYDFIVKEIQILENKYKLIEAFQKCVSTLYHFPLKIELHKKCQILEYKKNHNSDNYGSLLSDAAIIFKQEPKYPIQYALYLMNQKKLYHSLYFFRLSFHSSLEKYGYNFDEEILYYIKEIYYQLDQMNDYTAITKLIEIVRLKENQDFANLDSYLRLYSNNREILEFILFYLKSTNHPKEFEVYKSILMERDKKKGDSEYLNFFSL